MRSFTVFIPKNGSLNLYNKTGVHTSSTMKYIDDVSIVNKKVLVRVDFNVSFDPKHKISNDVRIQQSIPTIRYLLEHGNRVILLSHLGQPKGKDDSLTLSPVAKRLQSYLPTTKVVLVPDLQSLSEEKTRMGKPNQVFLLENIRFFKEEKENDPTFAKKLASLADIYVNDAFGVSHRKDASIVGLPKYLPHYGGLLLKKEVSILTAILDKPQKPFVSIIGGAKVSTKIKLIRRFIQITDHILLGGGLANTFLLAQGNEVGKSLIEKDALDDAKRLLSFAHKNNCEILLPVDVVVGGTRGEKTQVKPISRILPSDYIVDIGPQTEALFGERIAKAKTIVWNGPVGLFEIDAYKRGTDFIYYAIANNEGATSVVGGGETLAALTNKEHLEKITHISTGGGAMLTFLEQGTLPGIDALS